MKSTLNTLIYRHTSILDRYFFREFWGPFFLSVGGFALIGIVDILFYLVELVVISGISISVILKLLIYKLPAIMVLFFPMSVLFSIMLLLVRMAKDNELTILRCSGVHTFRILVPLLLATIGTTLLSYITNEKVVPWTNEESDKIIRREIKRKPPPDIVENVVFKDPMGRYFYIKEINAKTSLMKTIFVFEETAQFPRFMTAKKAKWNQMKWQLLDGYIIEFDQNGQLDFSDHFKELTIHVDQNIKTFYSKQKTAKEMDSKELKTKISQLDKGGVSTRALKVEYHLKRSIPTACLIFGLIGIAYCLSFVRSGKDWWGVIISICTAVLSVGFYFFIVALFRALGKDGTLTPFLSAWTPNLIYGSIASSAIYYQCKYK
ncbi:MAG: hypothetical protein CL521_00570 [Actinobacteria bacterium]|nr:hypothetical protein [Actinomycetota bacterium]